MKDKGKLASKENSRDFHITLNADKCESYSKEPS